MPDNGVQEFIDSAPGELQLIVEHARELIFEAYPSATESIKWNQLVFTVDGTDQFYVNHFTKHVNLGFMQGAALADPDELLEGTGKNMRHVKLETPEDVTNPALRRLIETAG